MCVHVTHVCVCVSVYMSCIGVLHAYNMLMLILSIQTLSAHLLKAIVLDHETL